MLNILADTLTPTGMLPRQVADDLKHGKPAPATQFTSATIFFRFEDL